MKLSFLIYSYFPYGGQQRDFLRILKECLSRGHEIDVYTLSWQGEVPENLNLIIVPVKARRRIKLYQRFTEWVEKALASQAPHKVVGFNKMPLLDIYFAADPCFQEKAETQRARYYKYTSRYRHFKRYEQAVFDENGKTEVLILSPQQRSAFSKFYPNCSSRLHEVPPGISPDRKVLNRNEELRKDFRCEFKIGDGQKLLLQIGSGFRIKGVDRSLHAIAALPDELRRSCHFMLVGQDKPGRFAKLAKKLGIDDRFSIFQGRDDIPRFLAGADLLLHPAYAESAGYVLLEATIAGLPVLTTASCGYSFHIEEAASGEVCSEPFDQNELNRRLVTMMQQLDSADWSENGLRYGKKDELYALPKVAADMIEQLGPKIARQ